MKRIDVPGWGKRWTAGSLVRDGNTLYRVGAGRPVRYHEDCLPVQRASVVRDPPADWMAAQRLIAIMNLVRHSGTHTPGSRGAVPGQPTAPYPPLERAITWERRERRSSYASYPEIRVSGATIVCIWPVYDDSPVVVWLSDQTLSAEAAALIAVRPDLTRYPSITARE